MLQSKNSMLEFCSILEFFEPIILNLTSSFKDRYSITKLISSKYFVVEGDPIQITVKLGFFLNFEILT